jgi:hypothetical protein
MYLVVLRHESCFNLPFIFCLFSLVRLPTCILYVVEAVHIFAACHGTRFTGSLPISNISGCISAFLYYLKTYILSFCSLYLVDLVTKYI